jgi:hypothetical protein
MNLDAAVQHAAFGAAGEVQVESHEVGILHVAEADLRRAFRRALQLQLGPVVVPEGASGFSLADWPGRLLGPDVVVRHPEDRADRAYAEMKWCRENKMFEVLWDLFKLSLAAGVNGVEAGYLVVGAPGHAWRNDAWGCSTLLADEEWSTRELLVRYERAWGDLLKGNRAARPKRLPETISTTLLAAVPIHLASEPAWELRVAKVEDRATGWVEFVGDWPAAASD